MPPRPPVPQFPTAATTHLSPSPLSLLLPDAPGSCLCVLGLHREDSTRLSLLPVPPLLSRDCVTPYSLSAHPEVPGHLLVTPCGLFCGLCLPDFFVAGTVLENLAPSGFWLLTLGLPQAFLLCFFYPSLPSWLPSGARAMLLCYLLPSLVYGFSLHDRDS